MSKLKADLIEDLMHEEQLYRKGVIPPHGWSKAALRNLPKADLQEATGFSPTQFIKWTKVTGENYSSRPSKAKIAKTKAVTSRDNWARQPRRKQRNPKHITQLGQPVKSTMPACLAALAMLGHGPKAKLMRKLIEEGMI